MRISQRGIQDGIAGVFSRAAPDYDSHGPPIFAELGRRLVDLSGVTPGARVLDVATGRGAVLFPAADRVESHGSVVGIDKAENMVLETSADIACSGRTNIELINMSAEQLDFPVASFDFVFCGFALWLFPHPNVALQEFYRVLKPGGCLALTTWAKDSPFLEWVRREISISLPPPKGSSNIANDSPTLGSPDLGTHDQIKTALRQAGFADIFSQKEEHDFIYASDEEWWASLWGHGLRSRFENLDATALEIFRSDMLRKMQILKQSDGIHTLWRPLFARSFKPC
ncbi:MAG: class I SAM-dependent methyltransferase [Hyphomicrobiaceae bacterium]